MKSDEILEADAQTVSGTEAPERGPKTFGYARVSSRGQADGNSLEAQEEKLIAAGAEEIYKDVFTGMSVDRPELTKLLAKVRSGDTIVVAKLDRLGRSISKISALISDLLAKGIAINCLDVGMISNDAVNTLMCNILLAFAQFERDLIVERTSEGKEIARRDPSWREGRPQAYGKKQRDHWMELLKDHTYSQVVEMTGVSESTLIREARKRGFRK